ncbi:MAG TPA: hypothetical protein VHX68_15745 [Planctomycetaceae bacterium]|jgi:hypothetical protein|nr:hypothetical protein [Planctomycetaceae bacterium]
MSLLQRKGVKAVSGLVVELCAVAGLVALSGTIRLPRAAAADELPATETQPSGLALELVPGQPHTLFVPDDVRLALVIRKDNVDYTVVAKRPTRVRPLIMTGSTALDPTKLFRVRARFAPSLERISACRPAAAAWRTSETAERGTDRLIHQI